jgi:hypothetical protein
MYEHIAMKAFCAINICQQKYSINTKQGKVKKEKRKKVSKMTFKL